MWIAGNHDFGLEGVEGLAVARSLPGEYLLDSSVTVNGVMIYGTPWVPNLPFWAFHASDGALLARSEAIPADTDILLSHGPPSGVVDKVAGGPHVGDVSLRYAIKEKQPRGVVCGHIHEARGGGEIDGTDVYNASSVDEFYEPYANRWVEFTL